MSLILRRTVFAFVLGAALTAAVFVGRAAHATTGEIDACFKPSNGTLYLLGGGSGRSECQPGDIPISWNSSGLNGQDGVSVTSDALAPGDDAACPTGGSKFTAANGVTYACNGANGQDGQDGQDGIGVTNQALAPGDDPACPNGGTRFIAASGVSYACNGTNGLDGQDGQDFSGTFTSPNGQYKLVVNDTTARLEGPFGRVQINGSGIEVDGVQSALKLLTGSSTLSSQGALGLSAATTLALSGQSALTLQSQGLFSASGTVTTIGGSQILLNGSGCGVLRQTDVNPFIGPGGGPPLLNPNGSPTVRTTC
jgi:hypothetical protein